MAQTVWHKQGGLDRTVVKKPREGLMAARIPDLRLLPKREREREREIVMHRLNPDCLFFFLSLLRYLLSFTNRTSYKATAVRPRRP